MNPKEFAELGFGLAQELEREANKIYWKDDRNWMELQFADSIRTKAENVLTLLSNPEVTQKLELSTLLSWAAKLSGKASLEKRVEQFEQLFDAFVDFAQARENWEEHFDLNRQKYIEIWEKPQRWEKEFTEKARLREEQRRIKFAEDLALARTKYSKPARDSPCFAEARKNGLNCNRSDLVEIKKLPAVISPAQTIDISIKRCSQCWQIYKELFEVDESTKQFRSRFLKPNETDAVCGLHFSPAEAEEYEKLQFTALFNPNFQTAETTPESGIEVTKNITRTTYEERGNPVDEVASIVPFVRAILPLLRVYGIYDNGQSLPGEINDGGNETNWCQSFGDRQGARLECGVYHDLTTDGYSGNLGMKYLQGWDLVNPDSGEALTLSVNIVINAYSPEEIILYFRGEESEIARFREAVKPVLEKCMWRYVALH